MSYIVCSEANDAYSVQWHLVILIRNFSSIFLLLQNMIWCWLLLFIVDEIGKMSSSENLSWILSSNLFEGKNPLNLSMFQIQIIIYPSVEHLKKKRYGLYICVRMNIFNVWIVALCRPHDYSHTENIDTLSKWKKKLSQIIRAKTIPGLWPFPQCRLHKVDNTQNIRL